MAIYLLAGLLFNLVFLVKGLPQVDERVLDKIAVPVEISGELIKQGDRLILRAKPEDYKIR